MSNVKYDTNVLSPRNIITTVISLVVTYMLCKNKGKKRRKKPFKTFSKSFNFISELWTSFVLKKDIKEVKEDIFPVKIEKSEIIHL